MRYRELCKKAQQLQKEWQPKVGDTVWIEDANTIGTVITPSCGGLVLVHYNSGKHFDAVWFPKSVLTWLPTLHQLVYMAGGSKDWQEVDWDMVFHSFMDYWKDFSVTHPCIAWLGFVLKTKFNIDILELMEEENA